MNSPSEEEKNDLVSRVVNPLAVVALLGALAKLLQVREGNAQVAVRLEWQRIAFRGSQKDIKRANRGCQAGLNSSIRIAASPMGNQVKAAKTQAWGLQLAPARHQAVAACATCPGAGGRSGGFMSPVRAVGSVRRCTR